MFRWQHEKICNHSVLKETGDELGPIQYKDTAFKMNIHCWDKISWPSYLHDGIPCTGQICMFKTIDQIKALGLPPDVTGTLSTWYS